MASVSWVLLWISVVVRAVALLFLLWTVIASGFKRSGIEALGFLLIPVSLVAFGFDVIGAAAGISLAVLLDGGSGHVLAAVLGGVLAGAAVVQAGVFAWDLFGSKPLLRDREIGE